MKPKIPRFPKNVYFICQKANRVKFDAYIYGMLDYQLPIDDISTQIVYDYWQIKKIFDQISHTFQIEFDFPQGGCQQRSHLMSMILSKKFDINHCKIWFFSPAALYEHEITTFFVEDKNKLSTDNLVLWNYHTAPMVKVNQQGNIEFFIIDPSLNRAAPMPLADWLKSIGNSHTGKYTFLRPEKYFFNCKYNADYQLTNIFDGTFFEFVNPAKNDLVLEKGLAINDMAMFINKKYIAPLMNSLEAQQNAKLIDLKDIFGNATVLDILFAQNLSGYTDNTSYRYVLTNYEAIIKEAKALFHERLIFWTKFTNELL